jgi:CRP-like cAMP-binding protein
MEIIVCKSDSESARLAFQLRYEVFGAELNFQDNDIDHKNKIYKDNLDDYARIYVAIKDGKAIATARIIYERECDFRRLIPEDISRLLGINAFLDHYSGSLAISQKFAISPSHRGSFAASLITSKMYADLLDDDIHFLFSMCAPYLISFYSQLGFHMYAPSIGDDIGMLTPILLVTRDWPHLKQVGSPLFKQIHKRGFDADNHESVSWFYDNYGKSLESYVSSYDDNILNKIHSLSTETSLSDDKYESGIFSGMSLDDISTIIGSGKLMNFAAGDYIIQTGNATDEMYVVIEGRINISFDDDLLSFVIDPGQAFGEISMLSRSARTADCIAVTDTKIAIISRQNLDRLIKVEPKISAPLLFNLSKSLSQKLRRTNEFISAVKKQSYWSSLILEIRSTLNLSQEEFSTLLDSPVSLISNWESGANIPSRDQQGTIEKIAADKNIRSLGGFVEFVRNSPSRMFLADDDYFVLASSNSSEWIENSTIISQLTNEAHPHYDLITEKLAKSRFWSGRGGQVLKYDMSIEGQIWHSVISSISIRDRIYIIVQQTIS